ncbi:MAG: cyclic nucleotide-binding/CBS domain-containing protein [Candidatus Woesearchaeota archaeon]
MRPDIPLKEAITVHTHTPLVDVAQRLRSTNALNVYVVDENDAPVGVIAPIDIVTKIVAEGLNPSEHTAHDAMNAPVETAPFEEDPEFALAIMMKYKTYACLVTENGRIKGIVEYADVLKDVLTNMGELDES